MENSSLGVFYIFRENVWPLFWPWQRSWKQIKNQHHTQTRAILPLSTVLIFCTLFFFCFWMGRPLQIALWAMKVNELLYINDVNYKQINNVFSSGQFSVVQFSLEWIDLQNLRCVYSLNKSWLWWYKMSFENWNKKSELFSLQRTYLSKWEKNELMLVYPDLVSNPAFPCGENFCHFNDVLIIKFWMSLLLPTWCLVC